MVFSENKGVVKENYVQIIHNELEIFDNQNSGFSLLINFQNKKILFDFGIKDEVFKNFKKINLKAKDIDYYVLSHGHIDHSQGLRYFSDKSKPLICHPTALETKYYGDLNIGCQLKKEKIFKMFNVILSKNPYVIIKDSIVFLGEIPRKCILPEKDFPGKLANGTVDYCLDDSAIAINTANEILLVVGCSHSGIENIVDYAESLFPGKKVRGIIGGLHVLNEQRLEEVLSFFEKKNINNVIPIHCSSKLQTIDKFNHCGRTFKKFYF
jgi:7,8-dihydropterin-6-yl-methyl-4-(beta-D-ribofuranosyl)aminobenzene 5'-phosphate synthase